MLDKQSPEKPQTQCCDLRRLPKALKPLLALPNFVNWKWEWKPNGGPDKIGAWTKPPFIARNPSRHASTNDPKTWSDFDKAVETFKAGKVDGVGFCLLGTNFSAFDIDDCRDAKTGVIDPVAKKLVKRAKTYAEITVSGTGLRIIGTGSDRHVHTKKKVKGSKVSVEAYRNCERYITISGLQLKGTPERLNDIDTMIDEVVAELGGQPSPQGDAPQEGKVAADTPKDRIKSPRALRFLEFSLPNELMKLIRDGAPEGDRSDQFHHAVKWLKDEDTDLDDIIALLEKYPDGIAAKYAADNRIAKEATRVYGKPDNPKDDSSKSSDSANTKDAKGKTKLILSSEEFTRSFTPPNYLWDGILLQGYVYSYTARTGEGKTAVALALSAAIALGKEFSGHEVAQGRVLYFAGENPDDVRMRWIAMAQHKNFDADFIDVHFISGTFDIAKLEKKIRAEVEALGGVSLIIIDTGPAFFQGESENDNVDMIAHAEMLRRLKDVAGNPTVLVPTHPVKNAGNDALVPRGGGGFLNAMDGNLCQWKEDMLVTMHYQGKFRGVDFEPMTFDLDSVIARKLIDSKGRHIPTVIAHDLSKEDQRERKSALRSDEDDILMLLNEQKGSISYSDIAELLAWITPRKEPNKSKVQRVMKSLVKAKLVEIERDGAVLTSKGKKAAAAKAEAQPRQ
jgi:hypothetical protein